MNDAEQHNMTAQGSERIGLPLFAMSLGSASLNRRFAELAANRIEVDGATVGLAFLGDLDVSSLDGDVHVPAPGAPAFEAVQVFAPR